MSSFLTSLSEQIHLHDDAKALEIAFDHFNQSNQCYNDLFEYLSFLSESSHQNTNLIHCLIQSFLQWRNQSNETSSISNIDENLMNHLILNKLPIAFLKDFCEIFQISKENLLYLLRSLLHESITSNSYKRALNIIVNFQYQLEFSPKEIILPLILNTKDHFIHLFIDKLPELEDYFLNILNLLYRNDGKSIGRILAEEFNMNVPNINKKALGKLTVRYWNLYGHERADKYPNLALLQHKRTLNYLINVKYSGSTDEKSMSNDAWNEMVEEIIQENTDLLEYLLEQLINKDDIVTVRHWITQSNRPLHTLPHWMQRYIRTTPTTNSFNQNFVQKISTNFYKIPLNDSQITFVDSMPKYECLFDRLFNVNSEHQDIYIGFDCEWKPMFNNTTTSEQRISVMQIAFDDHIFLLDMFHFFRTCDSKSIQQRLADRLFDDDHVTILCYGFRADASMLTSSYPIFTQVLASGKTLLDLSLVQHDLMLIQRDIFPYVMTDNTPSKDKGLSELVRLCFGKALDKSEQCSNWERRPLRTAQIHYAATDAYCLLAIKNFLQNHLESPEYLRSFRGNHTKKSDSSQPSTKVDKTN